MSALIGNGIEKQILIKDLNHYHALRAEWSSLSCCPFPVGSKPKLIIE
jgi:hypothetical protein